MNNREIIEELREQMIETRHWSNNDISLSGSSVSCYFGECIRCSDHSSNMVGVVDMLNVTSDGHGDVNVLDYELSELITKLIEFDKLFWADGEEYWDEQNIDEDDIEEKLTFLKSKLF